MGAGCRLARVPGPGSGRDLVRRGQSMHLITVSPMGGVSLLPASSWHFEGDAHPSDLEGKGDLLRAIARSTTRQPFLIRALIFCKWGSNARQAIYRQSGRCPGRNTHGAAAIGNRTGAWPMKPAGPLAQLMAVPQDGGDSEADEESDPLRKLRADLRAARGRAVLLETTAAGWGEGAAAAPRKDWQAARLGPNPPASMEAVMGQGFLEVLAACGIPPAMFAKGAERQRPKGKPTRRWVALTVQPLARTAGRPSCRPSWRPIIGIDLGGLYAHDLAGRARAFQSMVGAGMELERAAGLSGLMGMEG